MNTKMVDNLEQRAASIHLSTGAYCKIILKQWMDSGEKLQLQEK